MDRVHFREAVPYCISSFGKFQTFGQDRLQEAGHTVDASNLRSVEAGTNVPVAAFSLGNDSDEKSNGSIDTDRNLSRNFPNSSRPPAPFRFWLFVFLVP